MFVRPYGGRHGGQFIINEDGQVLIRIRKGGCPDDVVAPCDDVALSKIEDELARGKIGFCTGQLLLNRARRQLSRRATTNVLPDKRGTF
jgi:hypothetical protein